MAIPEGFAFVAGLTTHNARTLLAIAEKQKLNAGQILTTGSGFHVPTAVAEQFNKHETEYEEDERYPDPFSLEPPVTDAGETWTENTVAPEEQTLKVSTPFTEAAKNPPLDSTAQTGTSSDTQPADEPQPESDEPAGNASQEAWSDYAKTLPTWEEADAELARNELKEKYGSK